ncbi:hypothetical protein JR316_0002164 [Psilocybe cubensis]|uniref:Uncharacterized protein n=2 Tax=Psilocybe cubensis TaxID=181762 RepID=A0ACB8HC77_PSICU|nr:hypothetical protein JR316_0002164 [Psilocybe cubensis]KAH9485257.1 hypothetical protein JR316_0002164 [Psilocybe cubensis]
MPKATRGPGPGQLRPHSRSSSSSKLGANLQFTQKDNTSLKNADKSKKAVYTHEAHPTKPSFARVNSSQRIHSREQLAQASKRSAYPQHQTHHQQQQPLPKATNAKGFSLANDNADDDDEWESSNSGVGTPNHRESDSSDTASEAEALDQAILNLQIAAQLHPPKAEQPPPPSPPQPVDSTLPRIATARPADFETHAILERNAMRPITPPKQPQSQQQAQLPPLAMPLPPQPQVQVRRSDQDIRRDAASDSSDSRQSSRPKRPSRPPSTHSNQSRQEPLRPHPLIRGLSHGTVASVLPKPSPLAPLTVVPHTAPQLSSSPVSSIHDNNHKPFLSSSPTSVKTSSGSPVSVDRHPFPLDRRTSFSSARSVNTIPVHPTLIRESPWAHDRSRTLSTMSSSSSAALSALSHLPTVTRPPSPQTVAFFPPINPHANVEGIHPLLPTPYLQNHLTVLARRTPIRESFDRVIQAKNQNRR